MALYEILCSMGCLALLSGLVARAVCRARGRREWERDRGAVCDVGHLSPGQGLYDVDYDADKAVEAAQRTAAQQ